MGDYDWRLADTNVWKVERMLLDYPHRPIASSDAPRRRAARAYRPFAPYPGRKPVFYRGRERWTPLPADFATRVDSSRRLGYPREPGSRDHRLFIAGIFAADFVVRWWRENAWRRRWRERDDD